MLFIKQILLLLCLSAKITCPLGNPLPEYSVAMAVLCSRSCFTDLNILAQGRKKQEMKVEMLQFLVDCKLYRVDPQLNRQTLILMFVTSSLGVNHLAEYIAIFYF